jgi:hypothetical protein
MQCNVSVLHFYYLSRVDTNPSSSGEGAEGKDYLEVTNATDLKNMVIFSL